MSPERPSHELRLASIHINLIDYVVTLESHDGRKARLSFEPSLPETGIDTPDELIGDPEESFPEPPPSLSARRTRQQPGRRAEGARGPRPEVRNE